MTMAFALAEAALCVYIFSLPRHESVPTWIRPIADLLGVGLVLAGAILTGLIRRHRRASR
jgi:hypothetical protein